MALEQQLRRDITPAPASPDLIQAVTNAALQLPEQTRVALGSALLHSVYGTRADDVETLLRGCAWLGSIRGNLPLALCGAVLKGDGTVGQKNWTKLHSVSQTHIETIADQRAYHTIHPFRR